LFIGRAAASMRLVRRENASVQSRASSIARSPRLHPLLFAVYPVVYIWAAARGNLRQAIRRAPEEWRLWFDLAIVSEGAEARRAITRARELNPVGDEISDLDGRWDD